MTINNNKTHAKIDALPPLRQVIKKASLDARKNLGQNFLNDLNLTGRIARAAPHPLKTVIEIGPGPGGLTRALLLAGAEQVIAIEKDPRAIDALAPLLEAADGRLRIIQGDALTTNLTTLTDHKPYQIVANLPYNIATSLLLKWLDDTQNLDAMTLMFQREVGQRITAPQGQSAYGRLAVICQWLCETRSLFDVPPEAFVPAPKVVSSVIQLIPRDAPLAKADKTCLEDVTRALFGQRRKMLRSSIKTLKFNGLLDGLNLDGDERPETLSIQDFCAIAETLRLARNP